MADDGLLGHLRLGLGTWLSSSCFLSLLPFSFSSFWLLFFLNTAFFRFRFLLFWTLSEILMIKKLSQNQYFFCFLVDCRKSVNYYSASHFTVSSILFILQYFLCYDSCSSKIFYVWELLHYYGSYPIRRELGQWISVLRNQQKNFW